MKTFWALTVSEARQRRWLLLLGGVLGLLPVIVPALLPGTESEHGVVALLLTLAVSVVVAPVLGASVLSSDLVAQRLGFYLSRPIGVAMLVAAKVTGGLGALVAFQVLMVTPGLLSTLLTGGMSPAQLERLEVSMLLVALAMAAAVLLFDALLFTMGMASGLLVRLRSRFLALDAIALLILIMLFAVLVSRWSFYILVWNHLSRGSVGDALFQLGRRSLLALAGLGMLGTVSLVTLWLLAVGIGVARGRADGARVHRSLTVVAWPATWVVVVLLVFVPDLAARRSPTDPTGPITAAGGDGWVAVGGDRAPIFLHPRSGRTRTVPWSFTPRWPWGAHEVMIARSAPRAVWLSGQAGWLGQARGADEILSLELDNPESPLRRIPLGDRRPGPRAVSPDGRRGVMIEGPERGKPRTHDRVRLWAFDLDTGQTILETWVAAHHIMDLAFSSPTLLRFYGRKDTAEAHGMPFFEIFEADLAQAIVRLTGTIRDEQSRPLTFVAANLGAAQVATTRLEGATVLDGRSGAVQAHYPLAMSDARGVLVLDDGGIAVAQWEDGRLLLRQGRRGTWITSVDLGTMSKPRDVRVSPLQPQSAQLFVSTRPPDRNVMVDLTSGSVTALPETVRMAATAWYWPHRPPVGHAVARLALDPSGSQLFLFDPVTGQRTRVAGELAGDPPVQQR